MTLKILHVLDHSVPLHSGYAFRTLSILREQRKLGWQTLQLTTPKQGETLDGREVVEGFEFVRTPGRPEQRPMRQMRATAARMLRVVQDFRPDLVHAHSPILTALPSLYVARRSRLPFVYEVRATWEDAAVDHGSTRAGSARYRMSRALETFVVCRADHVTTICEGLRTELIGRGVSSSRLTVIPNGVDIDRFSFGRESNRELRARLGIAGAAAVVGFVGSFYSYEGLDVLLDAVALMPVEDINLHVMLVGGGPEEPSLKRRAEQLRLLDRVHFVGRVGHGDVQAYYDAVDVLVYARKRTRLTEIVTPLKPLEAMAQGKLVVASDVGGHQEMVRDGETGRLFRADDAGALAQCLVGVLHDRSGWDAMRRNARDYVRQQRSWEKSASGYLEAYQAALVAVKRGRS